MSTDDSQPKKPAHPFLTVSGLIGGVIGFYCGVMILIPLVGGMVPLLLAKRSMPARLKPFTPAFAVIFGHMVWLLFGVVFAHVVAPVIADLAIIVAGLLWLALRPGLGPVILLSSYEALSLVVNVMGIIHLDFGTVGHKALAAHIALRIFALAALIAGYREFRKNQAAQNIATPPDPL